MDCSHACRPGMSFLNFMKMQYCPEAVMLSASFRLRAFLHWQESYQGKITFNLQLGIFQF